MSEKPPFTFTKDELEAAMLEGMGIGGLYPYFAEIYDKLEERAKSLGITEDEMLHLASQELAQKRTR